MRHCITNRTLVLLSLGNNTIEVDWLNKPVVLTYQLLTPDECKVEVANKLRDALGYF